MMPTVTFFKDSGLIVAGWDRIACIWHLEKGALVGRPFGVTAPVTISPDDRRVASKAADNITMWDVNESTWSVTGATEGAK